MKSCVPWSGQRQSLNKNINTLFPNHVSSYMLCTFCSFFRLTFILWVEGRMRYFSKSEKSIQNGHRNRYFIHFWSFWSWGLSELSYITMSSFLSDGCLWAHSIFSGSYLFKCVCAIIIIIYYLIILYLSTINKSYDHLP